MPEAHQLTETLSSKAEVLENIFDSVKNINSFKIQLSDGDSPNDLLEMLSKYGSIIHFKELIPSVNDIFIQSVKSDSHAIA
jgi:ABC-2 type transport system ATP-binding protein